jgi:LuxR family transcriptional regulator, quorum-sensing system regulator SolR
MNVVRQEDTLDALLGATSEAVLFERVADIAYQLGFEYCAYGIRMPMPVSTPAVVMFNNYSEPWRDRYESHHYVQVDPTVQHALKSSLPLIWSQHVFEQAPGFWEEAQAHGLRFGWAQSSRDNMGAVGLLTLARSEQKLTAWELRNNQAQMTWLAQLAHTCMARLLIPKWIPQAQAVLSEREKDVLRWSAEGKTTTEIASILSITGHTVNFHIRHAMLKLSASNKMHAVAMAISLGMLF